MEVFLILRRLGNKSKLALEIIKYFPRHDYFIDMFFGAGGLFFHKPPCKWTLANDIDDDVFNLWTVTVKQFDELYDKIILMPQHQSLFNYWMKNKETDPVMKAVRFLMLSNFSLFGMSDFRVSTGVHTKINLINKLNKLSKELETVTFMNEDFRDVLKKIEFKEDKSNTFIYADPPYLGTGNNYSHSFILKDTQDLFEVLNSSGIRFALSEFDNEIVKDLARSYNNNIIPIAERQSLKNRNTEILITNYKEEIRLF